MRKLITGNKMIRVAFRKINLKLESLESKKSTVKVKVKPNESLNLVSESKVGYPNPGCVAHTSVVPTGPF